MRPRHAGLMGAMALGLTLGTVVAHGQAPRALSPYEPASFGIVYQVPGMDRVMVRQDVAWKSLGADTLRMDLYYPPRYRRGQPLPVVVFVNGIGEPSDLPATQRMRRWGQYTTWSRLLATRGFMAVTYDARAGHGDEDLAGALAYVRDHAKEIGADTQNIGAWAGSANVRAALPFLMGPPGQNLRCAALYYGNGEARTLRRDLPVLVARAGKDSPTINQGLGRLYARAVAEGAPWTLANAPNSHHAFDCLDDTEESRSIIRQTLAFFDEHLKPKPPSGVAPSEARAALAHYFSQEWVEAASRFAALAEKDPNDARLLSLLGISQANGGQREAAIGTLNKVLSLDPSDTAAAIALATIHQGQGEPEEARDVLEEAIKHAPKNAELHGRLGSALIQLRQYADAEKVLLKAVELNPNQAMYLFNLGTVQMLQGRYKEAIPHLQRSITITVHPVTLYNLACAYARTGDKDRALDTLERSVAAGFRQRQLMERDEDLASLRDDPRYRAALERAGQPYSQGAPIAADG
jgi:tetratricopeptide (TPR) repeat protein